MNTLRNEILTHQFFPFTLVDRTKKERVFQFEDIRKQRLSDKSFVLFNMACGTSRDFLAWPKKPRKKLAAVKVKLVRSTCGKSEQYSFIFFVQVLNSVATFARVLGRARLSAKYRKIPKIGPATV